MAQMPTVRIGLQYQAHQRLPTPSQWGTFCMGIARRAALRLQSMGFFEIPIALTLARDRPVPLSPSADLERKRAIPLECKFNAGSIKLLDSKLLSSLVANGGGWRALPTLPSWKSALDFGCLHPVRVVNKFEILDRWLSNLCLELSWSLGVAFPLVPHFGYFLSLAACIVLSRSFFLPWYEALDLSSLVA